MAGESIADRTEKLTRIGHLKESAGFTPEQLELILLIAESEADRHIRLLVRDINNKLMIDW